MNTQKILAVLLIIAGLGAGGGGWYAHAQVSTQLKEQGIVMPGEESLDTDEQRDALIQWAGETMSTGPQAKAYADHYIADHVATMAGGRTYQEVTNDLTAAQEQYGEDSEEAAELTALKATVFQGETLRSILLTAAAFWTMGTVALWLGVVLLILGVVLLVASLRQCPGAKAPQGAAAKE